MTHPQTPSDEPQPGSDRALAARQARQARHARASRARTIRRVLISGALSLFVAAWLLIAIVLVSGHDPALAARAPTTTTPVSSTPVSSTTATTTASTATTQSASASTAAVTTRQS